MASYNGNSILLGTGFFRILCTGSCQQDRFYREWRPFYTYAAESHPGGDFTYGIHCNSDTYVQRRRTAVEPSGSIPLPDTCSFFHFFEIKFGSKENSPYLCSPKNKETLGSYNG